MIESNTSKSIGLRCPECNQPVGYQYDEASIYIMNCHHYRMGIAIEYYAASEGAQVNIRRPGSYDPLFTLHRWEKPADEYIAKMLTLI